MHNEIYGKEIDLKILFSFQKNRGSNKIKTDNLKKFLAKKKWQVSIS
jgi:hypothetical protein